MAKSFRELVVWQRAVELSVLVYEVTKDFPKTEIYGLTSQMRRSAVSIPSDIAEGSARGSRRDFRQFVCVARGSNYELKTQLLIATRLQFGDSALLQKAEALSQEIGRMLSSLSDYLSKPTKSTDN